MHDDVDWKKLSRYLSGECSEEEEREVEAWLEEDPERLRIANDLQRIWEVSETPRSLDLPSKEEKELDRDRLRRAVRQMQATARSERESPQAAPDRGPRSRTRSVIDQLLAPFDNRLVSALVVLVLLAGGATLVAQMYSGGDAGAQESPYEETTTARAERATVRLADSTIVRLSVDTELRVPTTFGESRREVILDGEAYFEVTPDPDHPFTVRSGLARVRVLGTSFGVTAYPADSSVQVVVREGSVAMQPERGSREQGVTLQPNELGELTDRAGHVTTRQVDAGEYLGWTDNRLVFTNAPLPDVARRLERWYDIEVRLQGEALTERRLTATFDDASVGSVAGIIATTLGIQHRVDGQEVIFTAE
jgi:ferric-dicitrate binding protein FerR (iron transport regulator)